MQETILFEPIDPQQGTGSVRFHGIVWKLRMLFLLALVFVASRLPADAELMENAFDAANKLYEQGKYAEAAASYEKILQSGQLSPALLYNLGNAFFKSGQLGRAIATYRQAQQLTPRDPDLRANLQFARNQIQGPTLVSSKWQSWLRRLTLNEWTLLASGVIWALFILLAIQQWRPRWKAVLRNYVVALTIAFVFSCLCVGAAVYRQHFDKIAIVIVQDAPLHNGPLDESPAPITLHDGAELRVVDFKDSWIQVSSDPLRIGWVRRDQVMLEGALPDSFHSR